MENTKSPVTKSNPNQGAKQTEMAEALATTPTKKFTIEVAIRRRPGLVGLPGQDPAERNYKIGSSFDSRTRANLKGISDLLERKFLPSVIGVSHNAPEYRKAINDYWGGYAVPVPADSEILPPHKRGISISVTCFVNTVTYNKLTKTQGVKKQVEILNKALEADEAEVFDESVADYLLLNYCLKYSRVAANYSDIDKSPKIQFYIYEKSIAVAQEMSKIALYNKGSKLYQSLENDEKKIDAVLLMFKEPILPDDSVVDKLIKVYAKYNQSLENLKAFIALVEDDKWEYKYLISLATENDKLINPVNTEIYYYNNDLIGRTLEETVKFLSSETEESTRILNKLQQEVNYKIK